MAFGVCYLWKVEKSLFSKSDVLCEAFVLFALSTKKVGVRINDRR